jgi:PleD family two-component response regulator
MTTSPLAAKVTSLLRHHWADALLPVGVIALVATALFANVLVMAGVALLIVLIQGVLLAYANHTSIDAVAEAEVWRARAEEVRAELVRFRERAVHEDHDTGLGNLRQLELDWVKGIARFRRHGEPCCMVVFEISDSLGRNNVDFESISGLAGVLLRAARAEDSVCRITDGRFAILLTGSNFAGGIRFVQRVRVRANIELFQLGGNMTFLELLGGVAEWNETYEDLAGLLKAAEADLCSFRTDYHRQVGEFQAKETPAWDNAV